MAYLKTSDSIIISATLTDKGRKLLSRGKFKIAKFALGDDEIDYHLYDPIEAADSDIYLPALLNTYSLEAYSDRLKNIQYGLNSYDAGILYLNQEQMDEIAPSKHAYIQYLPALKQNNKLDISPTRRDSVYYVSVNDETTQKLFDSLTGFKFLQSNNLDNCKIIIESGIDINPDVGPSGEEGTTPTLYHRREMIIKKFLLDQDFFINADNRFISGLASIRPTSRFENFPSGETIINFETFTDVVAITLENEFANYASYVIKGVANLMAEYDYSTVTTDSIQYSALAGPRGSVTALNVVVDNQLKTNSTGERDFRFTQYGKIDQTPFAEIPTTKFDYIDTTIYIYGGTTNSRIQVPLRLLRYAGA
jgi:hypothetical protein